MLAMSKTKHLFVLEPGLMDGVSEEEVHATVDGLKEVGLYAMPYERDVYIQVNSREAIGEGADPNHWCIYGPYGKNQTVHFAVYDAKGDATSRPSPFYEPDASELLARILVVVLATKNVVKRTKENKLAKLGIGKKHRNRFAYTTTVSMPYDMPNDPDHPPTGAKVAPHLRRGHIRRQHYGAGNAQEKTIWIAPIFVNADPAFVASRKAYFVRTK